MSAWGRLYGLGMDHNDRSKMNVQIGRSLLLMDMDLEPTHQERCESIELAVAKIISTVKGMWKAIQILTSLKAKQVELVSYAIS